MPSVLRAQGSPFSREDRVGGWGERGFEFQKLNPIFHDKGAHAFECLNSARINEFKRNREQRLTITSAKSNESRSNDDQTTRLVIKEFVQHFRQERNRQLWSVKTEISLQLLGQYVSWSVDGETDASISFFLPLVLS